MDGSRGNVGPHRLAQVHLPVVSMHGKHGSVLEADLEGALEIVVANAQHIKKGQDVRTM
jgi:hypothetical protein